ncbi:hypothetical protein [Mucilaginibacter glaciei]|uniref:Transposase n=1 Tax=Mucilaginibacter glaciei TaxID=2772109 RepID=A0A926S2M5_9SPHI|nr:hypothetical protein [Mucilaginibacter glaciei]MBD1393354.1 hypothetical protein [Mucilaginibacter glaciei]
MADSKSGGNKNSLPSVCYAESAAEDCGCELCQQRHGYRIMYNIKTKHFYRQYHGKLKIDQDEKSGNIIGMDWSKK